MYNINEVTLAHINHLTELPLSQVLHKLLLAEAEKYKFTNYDRSVAFNITSGDGGNDGKMVWTGTPGRTNRLKKQNSLFQNKATDLIPSQCFEEIMMPAKKRKRRQLKSEVEKTVDADGSYILFTNKSLTDSSKNTRIAEFRRAITEAGKKNHATVNIEVFDANTIKDWVNEHASVVTLVQKLNDIHRPLGFRDWQELNIDIKADETPYQKNAISDANIQLIQSAIETEKVIRVTGHSGLGKTRLILETFRDTSPAAKTLQQQLVYYDVGMSQNSGEIVNYILAHRLQQSGIIVVDNCDVETHNKLSSIIKPQGTLKLITIGLEDNRSVEDNKIKLNREEQRDVVRKIVEEKLSQTHNPSDIEYVTNLSEGYPWMAVRFCKAILENGISDFNKFLPEQFLQKLLFGTRQSDEIEYEIIRACSVFSAFGFLDDSFAAVINADYKNSLQKQMDFIRTKVCDSQVTETKFRETCNKFLSEDIIERRGTYYIVKPTVLAIHLAAQWLTATATRKIKEIIEHLKVVTLDQKFLERLTDLDQLDKAKDIVEELWGPASFFGSAEVLSTSWGSLLFRYVVEVNPSATTNSLTQAFANTSKDELLKVVDGRRNLVWALEKLCFHKETFFEAAKVLFQLAVSENETWANNATNQIAQLFQRFLAGTEANYIDRIAVLEWALEKNDPDYMRIAIKCMGKAFIASGNHVRGGGAEKQGSGAPLIDFQPKTWEEIKVYWQRLTDMLVAVVNAGGENAVLAKNIIAGSIRTLVGDNFAYISINAVKTIIENDGGIWLEALSEFKKALAYEKHISPETIESVEELIKDLTPQTLHDQFNLKVIQAEFDYNYGKDKRGNYIDRQKDVADEFAEFLVKENIDWSEELPFLLKGEQRQTLNFGKKIGETVKEPKAILDAAFDEITKISPDQQNSSLIIGLLIGINDKSLFEESLDKFIGDDRIAFHAFNLIRVYHADINGFNKLFILIEKGGLPIYSFQNLRFGSPLSRLSPVEINGFCQRIASFSIQGKWTAVALLFMHCYENDERWAVHKGLMRELITYENLLLGQAANTMDPFNWTTSVSKLLNGTGDDELAKVIAGQLTEFSDDQNFSYSFDSYLFEVFRILFDQYFNVIWPLISAGIIADSLTYMHLKGMIGAKNGSYGKQGVLFVFDKNYGDIYQWCANEPKAVLRIAYMMPILHQVTVVDSETEVKTEEVDWHPFTKGFIDKFGQNDKMLDELSANMGSYGSVGSSVPYYQAQKTILEKLLSHSIINVRTWSKKMLEYTNKSIKFETLGDEQRNIE
ncbi:hypothetical protein [Mucilaginibacter sp.]